MRGRPGNPGAVCQTPTRASASGYASGLIKTLSITPKMAVFAPIPSAKRHDDGSREGGSPSHAPERMARIADERFDERQSSLSR